MISRSRIALLLLLACAPIAAACNAVFGIDPFEVYDASAPDGGGGSGGDAGSTDAADASPPIGCDGSVDLEGCLCETPGAVRDCYHGVPGPSSACATSGLQHCLSSTGAPHWGACEGGSLPSAEDCYDGLDNDCDGVVDQGCPCSPTVPLCQLVSAALDGAAPAMSAYNFFSIPAQPHAGQTFQIFVVTGKDIASPSIWFDGKCYGHPPTNACASAGDDCAGWSAVRIELNEKAGTHTIELVVDDPPAPPCTMPKVAKWTFDILT